MPPLEVIEMKTIKKAVLPAAGFGTRFLPATKAQPKEMLPIIDKPAIQYIVEEAVGAGADNILIITGRNKRAIEDHFDRCIELEAFLQEKNKPDMLECVLETSDLADIHYFRQKEQLGLGHAVNCASKFVGQDPFAVLLGDDIIVNEPSCLEQMIQIYKEVGAAVIAVQEVPMEEVSRYGIIEPLEAEGPVIKVKDLVEKPNPADAPSNLAVIGRYILVPEIFSILDVVTPGAGGEIQLTDALRILARKRKVYAYKFRGRRYDVGDKIGFLQATVEFALAREDLGLPFRRYLQKLLTEL